jgi:hypothetical protein
VGFSAPLINGVPSINYFQTDSYNELERWFRDFDRSVLINVHLIEPLPRELSPVHSRPFILSAYGTNNKANATDILQKWIYLHNECRRRQIRLIGFSTDCDQRQLRAMQLSLGFFAELSNLDMIGEARDVLNVEIPANWNFFFMRPVQLYLCMQDGVHLVTKLRNRLLSEKANMCIGGQCIDVKHLSNLIENNSKIDHNLVKSDVFPNDKQNYSSCLKITSDDVLDLLNVKNTMATYVYLHLMQLTILTYISKSTTIHDRLLHGWTVALTYRMWW